ncbi:MAG: hypothetical protein JWN99_160, partial [Ilumatobacteraceae bacterium]|nr:hypothetical protein [Ilumatobacteraceae bacterium]
MPTTVASHRSRLHRFAVALLVVTGLVVAGCSSDAAGTSGTLVDIGAGLQGPDGLTATQYATGLAHVAAMSFDSTGAAWAATASFDDDGTDGVYFVAAAGAMPVKVIADLHTPLGLLWIGDELFVASASRVDAYTGFDGTTFAGSRTVVEFD